MAGKTPSKADWDATLKSLELGLAAAGIPAPLSAAKSVLDMIRRHWMQNGAIQGELERNEALELIEEALDPLAGAALEHAAMLEGLEHGQGQLLELVREVHAQLTDGDEIVPENELAMLEAQRDRLELEGQDTSELREEIVELQRKLRAGPVLEAGQYLPGDDNKSRYLLGHVIGKGGFAEIWQAQDRVTRRKVAIKVLHGDHAKDRSRVERFRGGAVEMMRLRHPAIVEVIDGPRQHGGHHFFVMTYYEGGDLGRAIREGTIDKAKALEAMARSVEALAHAHANGVIHRDVKPSNILLDVQQRGWLTDFDLVRAEDVSQGTRTNAWLGTLKYCAPEQLESAKNVDWRADLYSVGASAYYVLTGDEPLPYLMVRRPELVRGLECGGRLRSALEGALAIDVAQRRTTCEELIAALRAETVEPNDRELKPKRGEVILSLRGGVELVRIPSGSFMMGSPEDEAGRLAHEGPQHEVKLASFCLAKTPVTNDQYAAYLEANPDAAEPRYWGDLSYSYRQQPVVGISWNEAKAFCDWAGLQLPTEAQWEYACRAGTTTRYWSGAGEHELARVGWYDATSDRRLYPVAKKDANPWGLHDMHGNVFEWCLDAWGDYTTSPRPVDGLRHKPVFGRVFRGGSFINSAHYARSASRRHGGADFRFLAVGFRPAQRIP